METRKREMNALIVVSKRYNIKNLDNQQKNKKNILERGLEIEVMPI
jgi:hypothetical protein